MINNIEEFIETAEMLIDEIEGFASQHDRWQPASPEAEPGLISMFETNGTLSWIEGYDNKKFTIKILDSKSYRNFAQFGLYFCNGERTTVDVIRKSIQRIRTRHANMLNESTIDDDIDFQYTDDDYDFLYKSNPDMFDNQDQNMFEDTEATIPSIEL